MTESFFDEQSEQSQIKAAIVTDYFWAWANVIIGSQIKYPEHGQRIAYIDLFAGPGRYRNGAASTPLMILEKAVGDPKIAERLVALFNDKDQNNSETLKKEIEAIPGIDRLKNKPKVFTGEVGDKIVKDFNSMRLFPTFFFVDPFGYKGLSLELVNSVLRHWGCDCVFFFNYNRINMGISNESVDDEMDALFGKERADAIRKRFVERRLLPTEREVFLVDEMKRALEEMGGEHVLPFRFRNPEGTRTTHHLFFVSKHFRGYEIMRDVMYKHSHKQGTVAKFEYNPADAKWPDLFEFVRPLGDLEDMLLAECAGQTMHFRPLFEKHSKGKGYVAKNYREVLCRMADEGKIELESPTKRRRDQIGPKVKIIFPQGGGIK